MNSKPKTSHVNYRNIISFDLVSIFVIILINLNLGISQNVFTFDCGDQQRVDTYGQGANLCATNPDATVTIPNASNVYQAVVEVVYKNENPGTTVQVSSNLGNYTLNEVQVTGGSSNVRVYRGTISGNVTNVSVNDNNNSCGDGNGLQSLLVYPYRNINSGSSQSGIFTEKSGYCDIQSLTIPISTDIGNRNLTLTVPISELTNDGRYLTLKATAGNITNQTTIYGPNISLGTCCLNIVSLTLNNVAGNTNSISLQILTDRPNNPANNNQCGQSYVLAGIVTATVDCTSDCDFGDAPSSYGNIGFDYGCGPTVKMGALIDADNAMQSNANADGDDADGIDDEDGVTFVGGNTFTKGLQKSITINYTSGYPTAYINGWIDWNGDGDFNDSGERIITNSSVSGTGNRTFNITAPAISKCGSSYARFVISAQDDQGPTGNFCGQAGCNDGEVEDYRVNINDGMNVSLGSDFEICTSSQVTLSVSVTPEGQGPFTYLWTGGGTGASKNYNVTNTSTYMVTVTDAGGCTASSAVTVTVLPSFTASADKTGDITCTAPNPLVRAFPTGMTYQWSGPAGFSSTSRTPSVSSVGTYTVIVTNSSDCTSTAQVTINSNNTNPNANITGTNTVCNGNSSTFTASGAGAGGSYLWSTTATTAAISVNTAGTYTVTVTNANGCTDTATRTLTVNSNPNANITGTNTVCNGNSSTFTASGAGAGGSYLWSTTATTAAISVNTAGTYTVTVTNANGCTDTATRTLTVNNNPNATITGTNTVCNGNNSTFTASGAGAGGSYLWSTTATTAAISVNTAGTYTVTVTNANGCTDTATRTLTVNNNPNATITGTNTVCNGNNSTFTASGAGAGGSYLWSTTATTAAISVNTAGTYTVTVTNANGCTDTATRTLTVNSNPNANITGTNTVCNGNSSTFTASGAGAGGSYLWSTTATTAAISVNTAGTYTVTVTNANGCTDTVTRTLTVNNNPNATITGTNTVCNGNSSTFTASGAGAGGSYLWSTTATTAAISVNTAGTYTVTVTNANGCTDTATRTLTVNNNPNATITGTNTVCNGNNSTFTASGAGAGGSYLWSTTATTAAISVNSAGMYTVTVTNANGCTDTATRTLTVNNNPNATITGTNTVCNGNNSTFTASGAGAGGSYLWSTTATTAAISVNSAGMYTVTVTNANGCTDTATRTLTVNNNPNATITGTNTVCNGNSSTFTASGAGAGGSYLWSTTATTAAISVNTAGTYTVTITNANGCTDTATRTLTVNNNPNATITGTNTVCNGNSSTFTASGAGAGGSYLWSTTATTAAISVNTAGTYTVTVTNANGCTDTATRTLTVNNNPNVNISKSGNISCIAPQATLTAFPASGVNYLWSFNNLTSRIITVNSGGTYGVTVTEINTGCSSAANIVVDQNTTLPNADAGTDKELTCATTSATLNGSSTTSGISYAWIASNGGNIVNGNNTATPTVNAAGTYTLTVTNTTNGCTATDVAIVILNNTPPPNASADNIGGPLTCIDNSATIRAFPNIATYTYAWSGPSGYTATSRTNNVSVSGNYTVTVTDSQNGCTASASTNVLQDTSIPTANAGPDKTVCNGTSTTITATGNGTYLWSTGATTAMITVSPSTTTTYTVTVTAANGCTASDAAVVTVTPVPASGLNGPNEICVDEYAVFNASPLVSGATYTWTFDGGTSLDGDANDPTESVKWSNTYQNMSRTVTLTVSKDNCSNTYTKAILVKTGVLLNTQDNYPVCQGGSVQIGPNPNDGNQVSPGATFQWTPNLFLNSNTVAQPLSTPPFDITYTLTATLNGCAVSRQITVDVNVNLNPVADAGQDKTLCLGNSVQIGGTPTATPPAGASISGVLWSPLTGAAQYQPNPMVSPTANTQYRVVVVASTGCTDTDYVQVTVVPKAKIGDYVWRDDNANGIQDTNEPGLGSVPVKLFNTSNVEVAQTTTNGQGFYEFEVCSGTYYVEFGTVTGYSRTIANTPDDTKDSDANVTNGRTQNYTLNPGDNNQTVDAGYIPNGKIGDFIWEDKNGNGQQDSGELGIGNITVQLLDQNNNVIRTTTTSGTGAYEFDNLPPGTYYVRVTPPTGYNVTTSNTGNDNTDSDINIGTNTTGAITLGAGETNLTIDAGLLRAASLGDYVWEDSNGNGIQDAGEPSIAGVTVSIEDASGNPARDINNNIITATTTGANGLYQFTNLKPGVVYVVKFNTPLGYQPSSVDRGGDDTKDSDANTTTGKAPGVALESGQNNTTIDAGYYKLGSLGDYVWDDQNGNGRQDVGEPGISGLTVTLTGTAGDGTPINQNTTTGTDGSYSFTNLKPGTYTVTFTKPTGTTFTGQDNGTDDKDSDASPITGSTAGIPLVSGQNITTVDAGVLRPASLGDYVWDDKNGNGVQDAGEPGISGVTVNIEDMSGNPARDINNDIITATTTGVNGQYQFTNLKPGVIYVVKFNTPSGYLATSNDRGGDDTKDSDANVTTGKSPQVTLTGGENNPTIDAGYYRVATIGDYVWEDKNGNGIQESGEPGIAGVIVTLTGTKGDGTSITPITVTTNANGSYQFTNLAPGTYTVTFTKPVNTVTTTADQGGDDSKDSDASTTTGAAAPVTVQSGETNNTIDAGYLKSASLGDFVWEDLNANGVQDAGEPGISGVTVRLEDVSGNQARDINNSLVPNATTGANGQYLFTNLRPGTVYIVNFIAPNGYTSTTKDSGSADDKDSDANPSSGKSPQVTLSSGENNPTIDAGYYRRASLGDYVWHDLNANGLQDTGEPGIGGVTVRLFKDGVQETSTTTGPNGFYSFVNLIPGTYTVKFDTPSGYLPTVKDVGSNDDQDSDANTVNGLTPTITLAGGEDIMTIDAGFYKLARIGDFVWEDRNANGVQDGFEPGIAGVTVTLTGTDAFGAPVNKSTTTSTTGLYEFTNLVPGSYIVTFTKPGDIYKSSPSNAGSDDAKDSDASVTTGQTTTIILKSGDNNQMIDAGFYRCAYVGDYVWLDNNDNNLQDGGDVGLNGVLVELYKTSNPTTPVQTMLTIDDPRGGREGMKGYYMFEICDLGNYFIKVKPDMNIYQYVQPNQGLDDGIDSDIIDFINQSTLTFVVSYAAQITDIDAGVKLKPLPVTITTFTGRYNAIREVNELKWTTASEVNNDYFEIERSIDNGEFEVIGKVAGHGQSTVETTYNLDDADINLNGVYTYRLRQVDYDGKMTQVGYVVIKKDGKGGSVMSIYPNPSASDIQIDIKVSEGSQVRADVYDRTGRLVIQGLIDRVVEGVDGIKTTINGGDLNAGVYIVLINIDGELTSHKLIVIE